MSSDLWREAPTDAGDGCVPFYAQGERVRVRPSASGERPPEKLSYRVGRIAGPSRFSRGRTYWPVAFEEFAVVVPVEARFLFGEGQP